MLKHVLAIGIATAGLLASSVLMAAPYQGGNRIDTIQQQQARLIQYGLNTGELTPAEAYSLRAEQQTIRDTEARFRRNGLSVGEINILRSMLARAEQHIREEMSDRERARNFRSERDEGRNVRPERNERRDFRSERDDWRYERQSNQSYPIVPQQPYHQVIGVQASPVYRH